MTTIRALLSLAGIVGGVLLSPWLPGIAILVLALLGAWEALALGLFVDLLWLPAGHIPFFMLGAIVVVWLLEPIRTEFLQ